MTFWTLFIAAILFCFAPVTIGGIKQERIRIATGYIIIILITILRYDVGYDYVGYFQNLWPYFDVESYQRLEPFGKLFMNLSHNGKHPQIFFALYGIVTFSCLIIAFKKCSKNLFLSVMFYLAFFYLPGLSTIRQEAAVCIILLGYIYIRKKNILKYIAVCIIAALFHSSALIAILFYPFFRIRNIKHSIIITIAIIALMSVVMEIVLSIPTFAAYYHYIEDAEGFKGGALMRFLYLGISLLLLYLSYRNNESEIAKMSLLSLIGCSMTFLLGGHIGGRIAEYCTIFLCIGIPNMCNYYYKSKIMPLGMALSLLFVANIYISSKNPTKSPYTPYQTIFEIDMNNPKFR